MELDTDNNKISIYFSNRIVTYADMYGRTGLDVSSEKKCENSMMLKPHYFLNKF